VQRPVKRGSPIWQIPSHRTSDRIGHRSGVMLIPVRVVFVVEGSFRPAEVLRETARRKKTHTPREGREDGTPPPHRDLTTAVG